MLSISHDGKMNIYIQQFNRPNKENILRSITVSAQNCWLAISFDFSKKNISDLFEENGTLVYGTRSV